MFQTRPQKGHLNSAYSGRTRGLDGTGGFGVRPVSADVQESTLVLIADHIIKIIAQLSLAQIMYRSAQLVHLT